MSLVIERPRLNALFLKCCALILGYALWNIMSKPHSIQITIPVPVSFYNTDTRTLTAPDTIHVKISGPRKDIFKTAYNASLHCDAALLHEGANTVTLSEQQIFLPDTVSLVDYRPTKIIVTVTSTPLTI